MIKAIVKPDVDKVEHSRTMINKKTHALFSLVRVKMEQFNNSANIYFGSSKKS
jgi:hypothetical protein